MLLLVALFNFFLFLLFILFNWEAPLHLCNFVIRSSQNLETVGFHPLLKNIFRVSQFASLPCLSHFAGISSVILTQKYFGILCRISRLLITALLYLSNFQFVSIKFLARLLNTLNQDYIFRLTILVFPIHYKLG